MISPALSWPGTVLSRGPLGLLSRFKANDVSKVDLLGMVRAALEDGRLREGDLLELVVRVVPAGRTR